MGAMEKNYVCAELYFESCEDNVVAHAGGGQANAKQLMLRELHRITTAAAAVAPFDSIMLPPARGGSTLVVVNHGANPVQVFGQPGDLINDVASAVGVPQMQGSVVLYMCFNDGESWYSEGLATGFASGFATQSSSAGLTAFATGGQAGGTPLTAMMNFFSVVANPADSGLLPPAKVGMQITVINQTATSMAVFPAVGETINGGGANASINVTNAAPTIFYCGVAGQWWTK